MTAASPRASARDARRARGDDIVWLTLGVVLIAVGVIAQWIVLIFLGGFLVLPSLVMLLLLRRGRHRTHPSPPAAPRE